MLRSRVLVSMFAAACLPEKSEERTCGEGTHEEGGVCVGDGDSSEETAEPSGDDTSYSGDSGDSDDTGGGSGGDSGGGSGGSGGSGGDSGGGSGGSGGGEDDTGSGSGGSSGGSSSGASSGGSSGCSYTSYVCDDGTGDYADIQDAVDDASDGDIIGVCAGTWGPVQIEDVSISLVGVDGADVTTIEGESRDAAIYVDDEEVEISGFTLRGTATATTSALYILNATASVHDIRIAYNYAAMPVWVSSSESEWADIVFEENEPTGYVFMADGTGSLVLRHSVFRNNAPTGHMLYVYGTDGEISNNLMYENELDNLVMYVSGHAVQDVYNNVIYGNTTAYYYLLQLDESAKIQNTIIAGNTSGRETLSLNKSTAAYCAMYDNTSTESGSGGVNCSGCTSTSISSSDCQLVDPAGSDFTLDAYSPCENAGNSSSLYDDSDGSANDLGAYGGPYGSW